MPPVSIIVANRRALTVSSPVALLIHATSLLTTKKLPRIGKHSFFDEHSRRRNSRQNGANIEEQKKKKKKKKHWKWSPPKESENGVRMISHPAGQPAQPYKWNPSSNRWDRQTTSDSPKNPALSAATPTAQPAADESTISKAKLRALVANVTKSFNELQNSVG
jgi:hypothetical protein